MKTRKVMISVVCLLLLATLVFIWGNSLESLDESRTKSEDVLTFAAPFLELFIGRGNVTDHIVRKMAHFIEFASLGVELALLCVLRYRVRIQPIVNCLFAGLAAAVTDEALQLISNRGSQVQDVLLDFSGFAFGSFSILALYIVSILLPRIRRVK